MRAVAAARGSAGTLRSRPKSAPARRTGGTHVIATSNAVGGTAEEAEPEPLQEAVKAYLTAERQKLRKGSLTVLAGCPSAPRWTLPRGREEVDATTSTAPGPGEYAHGVPISGHGVRGVSFGKPAAGNSSSSGSRLAFKGTSSPGPAYNIRGGSMGAIRGGAVGIRLQTARGGDSPGPGEYRLDSTLCRQGGASIGGSILPKSLQRPSSAPPRMLYPPARSNSMPTPRCSFGTAPRMVTSGITASSKDDGEGAPLYMLPSTLAGGAASCRAGSSLPEQSPWEVRPDPATYTPSAPSGRPSGQSCSFTRAARPLSAPAGGRTSIHLGPGSYAISLDANISGTPMIRAASAGALGGAQRLARNDPGPGPGAYKIGTTRSEPSVKPSPAYSIGKAKRAPPCAGASDAPGPAKYGLPSDRCTTNCRSGPAPRFPGRMRSSLGGGIREARAAQRCALRRLPGPGSFNPQVWPGPQRCATIGRARRQLATGAVDVSDTPGPGEYGTFGCELRGRGISMARGERQKEQKPAPSPGPGDYKAYSSFG